MCPWLSLSGEYNREWESWTLYGAYFDLINGIIERRAPLPCFFFLKKRGSRKRAPNSLRMHLEKMALSNASPVLGWLHAALSSGLAAEGSHICTLENATWNKVFSQCVFGNDYHTHTLPITTITTPTPSRSPSQLPHQHVSRGIALSNKRSRQRERN